MNRRHMLKLWAPILAIAVLPSLEGCTAQSITVALLNELLTAWTALEAALGKTIPSSVTAAFGAAVNAVNSWVPGTPIQNVVQLLQDLSSDVAPLLSGAFPIEVAAGEVVLGTIVNLIELIDKNAVPPVATTALAQSPSKTYVQAAQVNTFTFKSFSAEKAVRQTKITFEKNWKAVTGKAA